MPFASSQVQKRLVTVVPVFEINCMKSVTVWRSCWIDSYQGNATTISHNITFYKCMFPALLLSLGLASFEGFF
eukprot:4912734-Amphidinium_carterae.1